MYPIYLRTRCSLADVRQPRRHHRQLVDRERPLLRRLHAAPRGEAGGVASGTEAYYSFDWGNVHFICLDSAEGDRTPPSTMIDWLQNDLLAHQRRTGSSRTGTTRRTPWARTTRTPRPSWCRCAELPVDPRERGVDLVLTGHSHSYERSFLIDGHYGTSATLNPATHALDGGDGRTTAGDGAYMKPQPAQRRTKARCTWSRELGADLGRKSRPSGDVHRRQPARLGGARGRRRSPRRDHSRLHRRCCDHRRHLHDPQGSRNRSHAHLDRAGAHRDPHTDANRTPTATPPEPQLRRATRTATQTATPTRTATATRTPTLSRTATRTADSDDKSARRRVPRQRRRHRRRSPLPLTW